MRERVGDEIAAQGKKMAVHRERIRAQGYDGEKPIGYAGASQRIQTPSYLIVRSPAEVIHTGCVVVFTGTIQAHPHPHVVFPEGGGPIVIQ